MQDGRTLYFQKNDVFFFRFFVFWRENDVTRLAAKVKFQDMTKQINNFKRARGDRIKFVFFLKKKAQLVKELLSFDFKFPAILLLFLET